MDATSAETPRRSTDVSRLARRRPEIRGVRRIARLRRAEARDSRRVTEFDGFARSRVDTRPRARRRRAFAPGRGPRQPRVRGGAHARGGRGLAPRGHHGRSVRAEPDDRTARGGAPEKQDAARRREGFERASSKRLVRAREIVVDKSVQWTTEFVLEYVSLSLAFTHVESRNVTSEREASRRNSRLGQIHLDQILMTNKRLNQP